MPNLALLLQAATTLPLVGLIWMVQIVAYPLFEYADSATFAAYHREHANRITYVVAPLMLGELAASIALIAWRPSVLPAAYAWTGLALTGAVWLLTAFVSVPQHDRLTKGFDADASRRLTATNWLRTVAWTLRGALAVWTLARALDVAA